MVAEEEETAEVTQFAVASPEILRAMIIATELLEKLARGEITLSEAKAIYEEKIASVIESIRESSKPARSKRKSSSEKKTTRKRTRRARKREEA